MNNTDILASITPEQIIDLRDWTSDCLGLVGETVTIDRALSYVRANYPGGWAAFVSEVCTEVQPAAVEIVSNWGPDDCWDPQHSEAVIRFDGQLYRAHRVASDGLFFIRPMKYDGRLWTVRTFEEFPAKLAG